MREDQTGRTDGGDRRSRGSVDVDEKDGQKG